MNRNFIIGALTGIVYGGLISFFIFLPQITNQDSCVVTTYIENARYGACQRFVSENCNVSLESIKLTQDEINKMKLKGYDAENFQELIDKYYFGINITLVKEICDCPGY